MKKRFLTIIILFGAVSLLMSCASPQFIPNGSRSIGVYNGYFYGYRYAGSMRVFLFQTPEGDKRFLATIVMEPDGRDQPKALFVRGEMTGSTLEGEFQGNGTGTLSGQLSPDGSELKGSINLTAPDLNSGPWQAKKD